MPNSDLVALLHDAWADLDRAHGDLDEQAAMQRFRGGSAFGWTYAHAAQQIDTTINVRAQGAQANPVVNQQEFGFGGTGDSPGWSQIRDAALEVREKARSFLEPLSDAVLRDIRVSSLSQRREVTLEYYLCRITSHHWFHAGEVATKRDMDGQRTGEYPGHLDNVRSSIGREVVESSGSIFVPFLEDAWEDSDRAYKGLSDADATAPHFDGSPFGWTLAHFTGQMNMSATVLLGRGEQPVILDGPTIYESKPMSGEDWKAVQQAVASVRKDVGDFLRALSPGEFATMTIPPSSWTPEVHLKYMLARFIAHTYFHIGEVASKRDMLGHDAGDYPGLLPRTLGR